MQSSLYQQTTGIWQLAPKLFYRQGWAFSSLFIHQLEAGKYQGLVKCGAFVKRVVPGTLTANETGLCQAGKKINISGNEKQRG